MSAQRIQCRLASVAVSSPHDYEGPFFHILANVLDAPLLIFRDRLHEMLADEWRTTEAWLKALGAVVPAPLGVVLPLELQGRYGKRGELWGVELLRWLRWSAPEPIRLIPVLAVAWQPLEMILRAKHEPLLVSRGAWFARLPDVVEGTPSFQSRFITQVRTEPERHKVSRADLELLAGGTAGEAARLTHHDLANEGYSASRLWAGYLQALQQAAEGKTNTKAAKITLSWAEKVRFTWLDELKQRMLQPSFQQFQVLRRSTAPPKYPEVEAANQLVRDHAKEGLPPVLRVLLVDDEFDKGLADVLLKILFGNAEFTSRGPGSEEWVYSETTDKGRWVRLACVKNGKAAIHWLTRWGDMKLPKDSHVVGASEESLDVWLDAWARNDEPSLQLENLELRSARPTKPMTVILLDLRLNREEPEASYSPDDFESLRFRNAVKEKRPDLSIVMLTASRQALNYVAAMAGAGQQDGWLMKEAPDVPVDDENSARSVHYLLNRLQVFSSLSEWYRPELGWSSEQVREFAAFWSRPDRDQLLNDAREKATRIFKDAKNFSIVIPRSSAREPAVRLFGYIKTLHSWAHPLMPLLVARMVAVACLLQTADWQDMEPTWNAKALHLMVPQDEKTKRDTVVRGIYDAVAFHRDLWIPGRASPVTRLLVEEYEWLLGQDWGAVGTQCKAYVQRLLDAARAEK